jgi:hypothetical protein
MIIEDRRWTDGRSSRGGGESATAYRQDEQLPAKTLDRAVEFPRDRI